MAVAASLSSKVAAAAAAAAHPSAAPAVPSLGAGTLDPYSARQKAQAQRVEEDARIAEQALKHRLSSAREEINRAEQNAVRVSPRMTSCCVLDVQPCQLPAPQAAQAQAQAQAAATRATCAKRRLPNKGPEPLHDSEEDELTEDEAEVPQRWVAEARSPTNASRPAQPREASFGGAEQAKRVCTRNLP